MSEESPRAGNMSGCFLAAHPQLFGDPNFRRTIVYLTNHTTEEGARGLILNRPLQKRVGEISDAQIPSRVAEIPVFQGGPVDQDRLFLASLQWKESEQRLEFSDIGGELLTDEEIEINEGATVRGYLGYAGWSQGQLEEEIARQSWVLLPASKALVNIANSDETWKALMKKAGPVLHLLSEIPDDPGRN